MGNEESSPKIDNKGDHDLTIISNQEVPTEQHETHSFMLWVILIITGLQLAITFFKIMEKRIRRNALKKVKSIADLEV